MPTTERNGIVIDVEAIHVINSSDEVVANTGLTDGADYYMSYLDQYWKEIILDGSDFRADSAMEAGEAACRKWADL